MCGAVSSDMSSLIVLQGSGVARILVCGGGGGGGGGSAVGCSDVAVYSHL